MKRFLVLLFSMVLSLACITAVHAQQVTLTIVDGTAAPQVKQNIEASSSALLSAFNESVLLDGKKLKDKLKTIVNEKDPNGKELTKSIMLLWESSPITCSVSEVEARVDVLYGNRGYQVRDIPVMVLDADLNSQFQNMVFTFDTQGDLTDVNMAIEKHNYADVILENIPEEDLARRQVILDFVEVFRTAYNRKDINYLNQVYSNDALIITGKVLKKKDPKKDTNNLMSSLGNVQVEYQIQNKEQYIEKLKRTFKRNSYINIKFEDVSVIKHAKRPNIYGVTLKQYWNSSTYSDVGWLFLMINFEDSLNPSIEVRTWQPNMFDDGSRERTRDEVFNLDNFNI